jgi:1,4-dihydroxy-2-naphthoate octaprenyltransferase
MHVEKFLKVDSKSLNVLRKGKSITLVSENEKCRLDVPYGLSEGIVFPIGPTKAACSGEVEFTIRSKKAILRGKGKVALLGDPASHEAERAALVYRSPEALTYIKRGWVLAKLVPQSLTLESGGAEKKEEFSVDELRTSMRLKYLKALKPWTFQQTASSAVIASLLAPRISWYLFFVSIGLLLVAHSAFNMMNDYFDYTSSLDKPNNMGSMGSRVLVDKLIELKTFRTYMLSFFVVALVGGLYLVSMRPSVLPYFLIGAIAGSLYSVPRVGLRWIALGDLAIFLTWGPGIFLGTYVLQGGAVNPPMILVSAGIGMLVLAIAHINNWRDLKDERATGIVSVASLLGERLSLVYYLIMIWGSYIVFGLAVLLQPKLFQILGSLLTVPWAVRLTRATRNPTDPIRDRLDLETAKFTALHMYFTVAFVIMFRFMPHVASAYLTGT